MLTSQKLCRGEQAFIGFTSAGFLMRSSPSANATEFRLKIVGQLIKQNGGRHDRGRRVAGNRKSSNGRERAPNGDQRVDVRAALENWFKLGPRPDEASGQRVGPAPDCPGEYIGEVLGLSTTKAGPAALRILQFKFSVSDEKFSADALPSVKGK